MRFNRLAAAGAALLLAGLVAGDAAQAQQAPPPQSPPPGGGDRPADADRLHIFVVSAAIGIAEGGRGRTRPCEITSVVRAFCSAPGGGSRDGCEITDGQIGAREGNLFVEPYRTDILQSCGITSLSAVNGLGVTYICRGAWSSQTVGQVTRHERPLAFTQQNDPRQSPPWRIIMLCR